MYTIFVSPAKHSDHFVRRLSVGLSVRPSVCLTFLSHLPKLCFAGDTCIPRNTANIWSKQSNRSFIIHVWQPRKCVSNLGKTYLTYAFWQGTLHIFVQSIGRWQSLSILISSVPSEQVCADCVPPWTSHLPLIFARFSVVYRAFFSLGDFT